MKKIHTKNETNTSLENVTLSADAQTLQDFKTSAFIVSVMINVLLFLFWLTLQVVNTHA